MHRKVNIVTVVHTYESLQYLTGTENNYLKQLLKGKCKDAHVNIMYVTNRRSEQPL